ncbi:MAG TPA: GNAT family N-acetyltransferase [Ideonella sp.]|uniref:GNAT family N-acetyltransferase n=1 Tax=Ideonella sp. TaxID=1929293 RepID=UPI002E33B72C|nr:GNAT family N-acetyltransferase [Ideonella sp.]HEX5685821.1 GNAT family N-acetyltransferase [Ideonella sp.]
MHIDPRSTARLVLRQPVAADVAHLFAIYGDPATNTFNPFGPHPSIEKSRSVLDAWIDHWAERGFGQWAVATKQEPERVIGFGGVAFRKYLEADALNLGYRLAVSAWGQGYATELARAALDFALQVLRQPEVFAIVRPINAPSIRVLEKIGMQRIGTLDDVPGQAPSYLYGARRDGALGG